MTAEEKAERAIQERDAKIRDFSELLRQIENVSDKQKQLLIEIYTNAVEDRNNAYTMFGKLCDIVGATSTEHAVHGPTIVKYIERMTRANDQLIKLSEIIREMDKKPESDDPNDLYKLFGNKN